jgi:hypothetical protein
MVMTLFYYAKGVEVSVFVDSGLQPGLSSALMLGDSESLAKHASFVSDCVLRGFNREKKVRLQALQSP